MVIDLNNYDANDHFFRTISYKDYKIILFAEKGYRGITIEIEPGCFNYIWYNWFSIYWPIDKIALGVKKAKKRIDKYIDKGPKGCTLEEQFKAMQRAAKEIIK